MDSERAQQLRNELTTFASRWWAGEAEVTRTFFGSPRTKEEHLRWLRLQAYKELQPRPDGIIIRLIEGLEGDFPSLEVATDRHAFLHTIQFLEEEFRHYVRFADVIDELTGARLTPEELAQYELPEETKLREMRKQFIQQHGDLARFASSFCEGGGASLFYEGMQIGGDSLSTSIAAACRDVYEDEIEHAEHGADDLGQHVRSEEEWELARRMVEAISSQRVRMRNEQFGSLLSEARMAEIDVGQIELPARFEAMLV